MSEIKVWFLIPARAGSKTIPKKNIRELARKPLVKHVVETINEVIDKKQIIVSTDDENVKEIVKDIATIHDRSKANADDVSTLDDVAVEVSKFLIDEHGASEDDILITCQATSPFIRKETLEKAINKHQSEDLDTVLSVKDDRHLRWTIKEGKAIPLYDKRVNRQQMEPVFGETGGVISSTLGHILKHKSRIGKDISIIEVDEKEGLDIDTFADWALAEYWANKLKICIRVDGAKDLGFGHLYRSLAIAQNIHAHEVCFISQNSNGYELGLKFLNSHHYPIIEVFSNQDFLNRLSEINPDIVINDILDTDEKYMEELKDFGCFVVNFEDLGKGNRLADIVVNDLYPDIYPQENHWYGVEHAILNPNFEMVESRKEPTDDVGHILVAYGGTDPANLTEKAILALKQIGYTKKVTIILGPGHSHYESVKDQAGKLNAEVNLLQNVSNMAALMKEADLALTSAGRTVTELMTIGVPTLTMCQNNREMRHNHASSTYGIVNLGLGSSISSKVLAEHIKMFMEDVSLRRDMYARMKNAVKNRSNAAIVSKILEVYKNNQN
ncbi:cytidylyltransferase domain-containing protein [Gracilimonas sp. BCB1]|uniref:cytidylyltransferase domain-containing protein n=1 Tax=Gracilimonas sp. BCB1 TaxID=3152362 RepID=UPI0032D96884